MANRIHRTPKLMRPRDTSRYFMRSTGLLTQTPIDNESSTRPVTYDSGLAGRISFRAVRRRSTLFQPSFWNFTLRAPNITSFAIISRKSLCIQVVPKVPSLITGAIYNSLTFRPNELNLTLATLECDRTSDQPFVANVWGTDRAIFRPHTVLVITITPDNGDEPSLVSFNLVTKPSLLTPYRFFEYDYANGERL